MYELLLSAVAQGRHEQLLRILAGVSAMPPTPVKERHLVFRPMKSDSGRTDAGAAQVGGSQDIAAVRRRAAAKEESNDLWYIQLIQTSEGDKEPGQWEMVFFDLPEAVKQPVTARTVERTFIDDGDVGDFMAGLGYTYVNQYLLTGHRFVHSNLILFLHQVLVPSSDLEKAGSQNGSSELPFHSTDQFVPLDESGAYILNSSCYMTDGAHQELKSRGMREQMAFKDTMKGIIDMRPVERLALDARVKQERL